MTLLLFLAACFLAYSNGANDNFKGVASLFGSKTTSYGAAIGWAGIMMLTTVRSRIGVRRDYESLLATDFFPREASLEAEAA